MGGRLSSLLERFQQYQDDAVSLHSWLSTQEQNDSIAKPSADSDPQTLQNTLRQVQVTETVLHQQLHFCFLLNILVAHITHMGIKKKSTQYNNGTAVVFVVSSAVAG